MSASGNRLGNSTNVFIQFIKAPRNILLLCTKRRLSVSPYPALFLLPYAVSRFAFRIVTGNGPVIGISHVLFPVLLLQEEQLQNFPCRILPQESSTLSKYPRSRTNYPLTTTIYIYVCVCVCVCVYTHKHKHTHTHIYIVQHHFSVFSRKKRGIYLLYELSFSKVNLTY